MKVFKIILKVLVSLVLIVLVLVGAFLIYAAITTLHPEDKEDMTLSGEASSELKLGDTVKIMSWNVGYGSLGDNEDYFLDGGKNVNAQDKDRVEANLKDITSKINEINPDLFMVQEVDIKSKRSCKINEREYFEEKLSLSKYVDSFAHNYKAGYVPYPFPTTIGHVEAGIMTFSKYDVTKSTRIQLPIAFSWPISMVNLKRCLLVDRVKIKDSDKELVIVNLHLEAYDDGEGKVKQTNMLKEVLNEEYEKGNYVIAGGDFNQTFSNIDQSKYPIYESSEWVPGKIDATEFENFNLVMDTTNPTCRLLNKPYKDADKDTFQYYMIDGFMVSKNITINSLETKNFFAGQSKGS